MSLFWKDKEIVCSLYTKDGKLFRYAYIEYKQKLNWKYLFGKENADELIKKCVQEWFTIWVEQAWIYEGEDTNRLIDTQKLKLVNSHINTMWNLDYERKDIKDIKITHLIR